MEGKIDYESNTHKPQKYFNLIHNDFLADNRYQTRLLFLINLHLQLITQYERFQHITFLFRVTHDANYVSVLYMSVCSYASLTICYAMLPIS